jgi:ABC-2 type transport system ATP-binding protein
MQTTVLSLQDVTIRYGAAVAVDALCLEVRRGEVFGLLGPNGCGKSSTLAAITGLLRPAAGVIRIEGRREEDDPFGYRRRFGLVPQELAVYEELTAEDNLSFFGRLYGLRGRELHGKVADALRFVRLNEQAHRPARTFSGGMQRRLNLACALLHEPPLLLLDEPTVGLDVQSREAIFASLRVLRDRGCALVFTTHHLEEAEQLCDRIGIMDHGLLVAAGTLDELDADPPIGYTAEWQWHDRVICPPSRPHRPRRLERVFLELTGRSPHEP